MIYIYICDFLLVYWFFVFSVVNFAQSFQTYFGILQRMYKSYQLHNGPAELVTSLVTERGVCDASKQGLLSLYPERRG